MSGYDAVAPWYDFLAEVYSLGAIGRAKRAHVALLQPGERVLYAGGGSCEEGVHAARAGARVTVVDRSLVMGERARRRFAAAQREARVVEGDALEPIAAPNGDGERFDHVVAPFFVNVFARGEVGAVLRALCAHLCPGGRLTVVDFQATSRHPLVAFLQEAHHALPLALFHLLTANPWHRIHDDRALVREAGLGLEETAHSVHPVLGLPAYESITWRLPVAAGAP